MKQFFKDNKDEFMCGVIAISLVGWTLLIAFKLSYNAGYEQAVLDSEKKWQIIYENHKPEVRGELKMNLNNKRSGLEPEAYPIYVDTTETVNYIE